MIICKNCGAELNDGTKFCIKCGTKVEEDICPNCGEELLPDAKFCIKCGATIQPTTSEANQVVAPAPQENPVPTGYPVPTQVPVVASQGNTASVSKSAIFKAVLLGILGLAVIAAILLVAIPMINGSNTDKEPQSVPHTVEEYLKTEAGKQFISSAKDEFSNFGISESEISSIDIHADENSLFIDVLASSGPAAINAAISSEYDAGLNTGFSGSEESPVLDILKYIDDDALKVYLRLLDKSGNLYAETSGYIYWEKDAQKYENRSLPASGPLVDLGAQDRDDTVSSTYEWIEENGDPALKTWLNGQYKYYHEDESISAAGNTTITAEDCENNMSPVYYYDWVDDFGARLDISSGSLYILWSSVEFESDPATKSTTGYFTAVFYYQNDLSEMHSLTVAHVWDGDLFFLTVDGTKYHLLEESYTVYDTYILPESSQRKLTYSDISHLSSYELMLARNEIYARHGRKFKDSEIREYFTSQSWYYGYIEPADFSESLLSDIERYNVEFIKKYE